MTDIIYYKNGEETFRISPPPTYTTKCPKTKLEIKMTCNYPIKKLNENTIILDGVKYQKVEEPQSFYDKLWELISAKVVNNTDTDELTDGVMDLIKRHIPTPMKNKFGREVIEGYNTAIKDVQENFK